MSSPEVSGSETKKSLKRRRDSREPPASKRSQKRKRVGTRRANVEDIDEERGINLALGRMNPDLLADYVARKTQRFEDKATLVELEDRRIPGMFLSLNWTVQTLAERGSRACRVLSFVLRLLQWVHSQTQQDGIVLDLWTTSPTFLSISQKREALMICEQLRSRTELLTLLSLQRLVFAPPTSLGRRSGGIL